MSKNSCTCLIPIFNEEKTVLDVLKKISKVKYFDQIILVNDWSTDWSFQKLNSFLKKEKNQKINIVSYKKNQWKSYAVRKWLEKVKTEYVFLFDADIKWIEVGEIENVIENIYKNPEIDMGILRRIYAKWYIKIFYRELILSWQRMLRTNDLKEVYKKDFTKYQLEIAINYFMEKNKKMVLWYPFSGENTFKNEKRWFFDWCKRDIKMFFNIFDYNWFFGYIRHSFSFNPIEAKKYKEKS